MARLYSTRRPLTYVVAAICLAVAFMVVFFLIRHHDAALRKQSDEHEQQPQEISRAFAPEIRALQTFSKLVAPDTPEWSIGGEANGTSNQGAGGRSGDRSEPRGTMLGALVRGPNPRDIDAGAAASTPTADAPSQPAPEVRQSASPLSISAKDERDRATGGRSNPSATEVNTGGMPASMTRTAPGVQCGDRLCDQGLVCCNQSCGTCAKPGETCSQQVCGVPTSAESTFCGLNTCNVGEVCCNPYCGYCARSTSECDPTLTCSSPIEYPRSVSCGMVTCNTGLVCCNASCGLCAPYGEPCSQDICG